MHVKRHHLRHNQTWVFFSFSPELHIAFWPIFIHPFFSCLNPINKNGSFVSVVALNLPNKMSDNHCSPCLCESVAGRTVMTAFRPDRIWPEPLLAKKSAFGQLFFVTAFVQTAFGRICVLVFWPCLVKCVLAFGWVCSSVLWLLCVIFLGVFNIFWSVQHFWTCSMLDIFGRVQQFCGRVQHFCPSCSPGPSSPEPLLPGRTAPLLRRPPKISFFFPLSLGLHTTAQELQTRKFEGPGASKHHQNSTRRPPREGRQKENGGGREEKEKKKKK